MRLAAFVALCALVAGLLAASAASAAQTPVATAATTTVRVTMLDFSFKLSRQAVPRGKVIFKVVNKGKAPHDFKIAGKKTPVFGSGKSATLTARFTRKKRYFYLCTVVGHVDAGMFGYLTVR